MSTTIATPASLGPWSLSQRKAASRIFAQALFSALPSNKPALCSSKASLGSVTWKAERNLHVVDTVPVSKDCLLSDDDHYNDDDDDDYSSENGRNYKSSSYTSREVLQLNNFSVFLFVC